MAVAEISEVSTPEEIEAFVDEIAADRMGESAPEEKKSDAEIVNSVAAIETPAPKKGDETAEAPQETKGKGEKAPDRSWLDDDLKSEVAAYGIGEDELADFTSREEVQRALRFFDKSALEAGRKAMAEGESKESGRDEKGRFTKVQTSVDTETPATEPEKAPAKGGYQPQIDRAVYDDAIVDEFERMRDHYEARLETLEARFAEADAKAEEQHFDSLVDAMGHADLFGKTGHENEKQLQRRKDLHGTVKEIMLGRQVLGRPTEMSESLVSRAAKMAFAEELGKKDLKSRTSRIAKQSNGRLGGGVTRPSEPREDPRDEFDRLWREMAGR